MRGLAQLQFLKQLEAVAPPNHQLFVSGEWKGNPTKPMPIDQWPFGRRPASFRSILANEVLFDLDTPTWDEVLISQQLITSRLAAVDCPYYEYNSAGKGWHICVYLDAHGVEAVTSWRQIRQQFWAWGTYGGAKADRAKVAWGNFSVVRCEGASRTRPARNVDELFSNRIAVKAAFDAIPPARPQPHHARYFPRVVTFPLPSAFLLTLTNENGLQDCPTCDVAISPAYVSYDDFDEHVESVTCSICFRRQRLAAVRLPLDGEWRYAIPSEWLP